MFANFCIHWNNCKAAKLQFTSLGTCFDSGCWTPILLLPFRTFSISTSSSFVFNGMSSFCNARFTSKRRNAIFLKKIVKMYTYIYTHVPLHARTRTHIRVMCGAACAEPGQYGPGNLIPFDSFRWHISSNNCQRIAFNLFIRWFSVKGTIDNLVKECLL